MTTLITFDLIGTLTYRRKLEFFKEIPYEKSDSRFCETFEKLIFPEVVQKFKSLHDKLREKKYKLALATASPHEELTVPLCEDLKKYGIFFDYTFSMQNMKEKMEWIL